MNGLREKFHNNKGFTLIEMLMVVAIIAILIAVSIPVVGQALERAREATDAANERSFKAELMVCYLASTVDGTDAFNTSTSCNYAYDAENGKIVTIGSGDNQSANVTAYGQGTTSGRDGHERKDKILYGFVTSDGTVGMGWGKVAGSKDAASINLTLTLDYINKATEPAAPGA